MSNIVNKLIYNTLVQSGSVSLPYLGSLHIEGEPKRVVFEEEVHSHMPSIISVVISEGGVSKEEAERLYNDWLASSKEPDGAIFVEGVGRISPRQMEIEPSLNRALNGANAPLPSATLSKRKKNTWVWIVLALLLLLVGGGAVWFFMGDKSDSKEQTKSDSEVTINVEVTDFEEAEELNLSRAEAECGTPAKQLQGIKGSKAESPAPQKEISTPAPGKRYNVAVGVFSIKWNAQECTRQDPLGIGTENYLVDRFPSNLWVVIAHSTDDWREAEKMRKAYKKIQKDVWVYRRY